MVFGLHLEEELFIRQTEGKKALQVDHKWSMYKEESIRKGRKYQQQQYVQLAEDKGTYVRITGNEANSVGRG